ncbi:MAG TPA: hypothetical protein QF861_06485 [Alphaproteobacteria bacterium]|nr:hypothetical protein [Alphaproteobacteria bacterium]
MPGAQEGDADGVDLRRQHGGIIAHQAEYHVDSKILEVVGQRLVGRYESPGPAAGTIFRQLIHIPPVEFARCYLRQYRCHRMPIILDPKRHLPGAG